MKATFPGEYVHMINIELPTLKDGKVTMFISVDNFSRYCFSNVVINPLTFENLTDHLDNIIAELQARYPSITPTFILGYGDNFQSQLELRYIGKAYFR